MKIVKISSCSFFFMFLIGLFVYLLYQKDWVHMPTRLHFKSSKSEAYKYALKMPKQSEKQIYEIVSSPFEKKQQAERLFKQLATQHYHAYLEMYTVSKQNYYVVKIGPYLHKSDAKQLLNQIKVEGSLQVQSSDI